MNTIEVLKCQYCGKEFEADCRDLGTYFCHCRPVQKIDLAPIEKIALEIAAKYKRGHHDSIAKN